MPLIDVRISEGVFDADQNSQMHENLNDTLVEIEGQNLRPVTWVVIEGVASGDRGIGGSCLGTADVRARAAGARPV